MSDEKCICYVNMTVSELKQLHEENLLAEAMVGSIPTHFKEKQFSEVIKRAAIAPGNMEKLREILLDNEKKSVLDETELVAIKKLHSVNLYHTEKAIWMSLYELINGKFHENERDTLEAVVTVIARSEGGGAQWNDMIEKAMLERLDITGHHDIYIYIASNDMQIRSP
ncbi:MAG: hypothetical protein WC788_06680 [Candidatus Paceibacterota bacterium]